ERAGSVIVSNLEFVILWELSQAGEHARHVSCAQVRRSATDVVVDALPTQVWPVGARAKKSSWRTPCRRTERRSVICLGLAAVRSGIWGISCALRCMASAGA